MHSLEISYVTQQELAVRDPWEAHKLVPITVLKYDIAYGLLITLDHTILTPVSNIVQLTVLVENIKCALNATLQCVANTANIVVHVYQFIIGSGSLKCVLLSTNDRNPQNREQLQREADTRLMTWVWANIGLS